MIWRLTTQFILTLLSGNQVYRRFRIFIGKQQRQDTELLPFLREHSTKRMESVVSRVLGIMSAYLAQLLEVL